MMEITLNITEDVYKKFENEAFKKHISTKSFIENLIENSSSLIKWAKNENILEQLKQYIKDFYYCVDLLKDQEVFEMYCPTTISVADLYDEMNKMFQFIQESYKSYIQQYNLTLTIDDFVERIGVEK